MRLEQQEQGGEDVCVINIWIKRRGAVQTRLKRHRLESRRNIRASQRWVGALAKAVPPIVMRPTLAGLVRVLFLLGIGFLFHDRALDVGRDQVRHPIKD